MSARSVPPIGTPLNAFTGANPGAGGVSAVIDPLNSPFVSAFGHVGGATTIMLQYSADGATFYDSGHTASPAGAADFCIDAICGAQYVRLKTTNGVVVTATVQAKDGGS